MSIPAEIRSALADNKQRSDQYAEEREALVIAGDEAGIPKTELASLTGVARQTIYDILDRHAKRKVAEERRQRTQVDAGEIRHKLGRVVEDRWRLRWAADLSVRRGPVWRCRSAGLRICISGGQLAERGPLTHIRDDVIFTMDPEVRAEREAARAVDGEVLHDGTEDPESDGVPTTQ